MINSPYISKKITFSNRILWHLLFYLCLFYNFHRYIFKYSHGAYPKEGYQQTPLIWQAGKFVLVTFILFFIYLRSTFTNRMPINLLFFYGFIGAVLLINMGSALLYNEVLTDEIEYAILAMSLLPIGFLGEHGIKEIKGEIDSIINISQYIIILSNIIVIFNYFVFRIVPFHAYEGILLRFGGLWDDPNTLAILSVFMLGYALMREKYILAVIHIINIIMTISLNGYILLFTLSAYFFLNTKNNKFTRVFLFGLFIILILIIAFINIDLIMRLYEAKRESIEQHATVDLSFSPLPLLQPVQFHETWFISLNVNYFPISILITTGLIIIFVQFFLFKPKSLQRLMFILFFTTNLFLPFLYMFPLNIMSIFFLILYTKNVRF